MKRHYSILACLILVVAMVFTLASCNLFKPEHTHSYENGVCGECGEADPDYVPPHSHNFVDGKCECGEEDPNYVPPHEHSFVNGKCECGAEDPNYVPECTEHAFSVEVTKEATCTEAGEKTLTCSLCGHVETSEIAPNGHTEEKVEGTAPTCTEAGLSDGKKCTVCGETTVEQVEINATGHSFVEGTCSACGAADPEYNGPKTHEWNFGLVDGSAATDKTYIADGTTYDNGYFTTIGEVYYRYKDGAVYCVEVEKEGRGAIQFTVTGTATVEVMFSSTGGSNTSWVGIIDADGNIVANNEGANTVTGANDGKTVFTYTLSAGTYRVVSPLIKQPVLDADGNPTYNEDGTPAEKNPYSRAARVYYVNVTETPAEEAPKNEIKVTTTDTYGWFDLYSFTADAEGYYTFNLPAGLGFYSKAKYDLYKEAEVDYYYNETGATAVVGIKAGETFEFYVGALTKSDWVITWTFEAGEVVPEVEVCDHWWMPAMGHEDMVLPTCQAGGVMVYQCFSCGEFKTEEVGPDTEYGHDYVIDQTTYVETTCQVDGYQKETCSICGDVKESTFDHEIYGMHDNVLDEESYKDPTCQDAGYSKYTCSVCGTVTEETSEPDVWYHQDVNYSNGSISVCSICNRVQFGVYVDPTETTYGIQFGMNYGTGALWFAAFNADNSVFEMYGYTATLADGVYTITLDNMNAYETSAYGLLNATITVKGVCGGVDVTITPAEGEAVVLKNYEGDGVHTYAYACDKACSTCYEITNPNAAHTIVHVEAKAGTDCQTWDGNIEYWYCSDCGSAWTDEALTQVTNKMSVSVVGDHVYTYACDKACAVCYEVTRESAEHTIVAVDAKAGTDCQTWDGNVAYWYCSDCGNAWADEALTQVTNKMSVSVAGDHVYTYACDKACAVCYEITNENASHTIVAVDAKAATCTANGNVAYWYCSDCGSAWTDEALTQVTNQMSVKLAATSHADENGDYKCDACSTKMLPADGSTLTIAQALVIAKMQSHNTYTTQKYYITGIVTNVYNTQYGNFYLKDADGNEICIYGLYMDGTRYDAMSYKPIEGDEVTVYGPLGAYNTTYQMKNAELDDVVAHEHDYVAAVTAPTCVAEGFTTHTCSICKDSYTDSEVAALGHTTDNGVCGNCGLTIGGDAPVIGTLATFDFGANGSASHVDGNDLGTSKSYTVGTQTLSLTSMSKVYGPAYDAKGNSCIKLGTSKLVGSFTFTVGEDVTEVVIYVAKYKANATTVSVNGTKYTLANNSNDGAYDEIVIDTSVTKTITFATVASTYRCMIDKIVFNGVVA